MKDCSNRGDDYSTCYLLDYPYFKEHYKLIAINLSKQEVVDTDTKAIQEINFTVNLEHSKRGNTTRFFIIEEAKSTILEFLHRTVKVLLIYFALI